MPTDPYAPKRAKVYFKQPAVAEALEVLALRNRAKGRLGDNFSSLLVMLGREYVQREENLQYLRAVRTDLAEQFQ